MVSDGIKAARIQAQYSPLINSTWPGMALQANMLIRRPARHGLAEPAPGRPPGGPGTPGRRARCSAAGPR